jgi:hypothetical protein
VSVPVEWMYSERPTYQATLVPDPDAPANRPVPPVTVYVPVLAGPLPGTEQPVVQASSNSCEPVGCQNSVRASGNR